MAKKTAKKKAAPAKKAAAAKKKVAKKTPAKKAPGKKTPVKNTPPKNKTTRSRSTKEIRLKAYWGVFNQSLRRVAIFEFDQRKQAEKKAAELTKSGKSPYFVQPVKEVIDT